MKDKERIKECETVHLFIAIRRKKDNDTKDMEWRGEWCFRRVIRNEEDDLEYMRTLVSRHPGVWRIYKTINSRDVEVARRLLITKLVIEPEQWSYRVDSLWKTCLLQPVCKAERNFLIDVDDTDQGTIGFVKKSIELETEILYSTPTPNGHHFVTGKFDTTKFNDLSYVEIKRDGYIFVDKIDNTNARG